MILPGHFLTQSSQAADLATTPSLFHSSFLELSLLSFYLHLPFVLHTSCGHIHTTDLVLFYQ